MNKTSPSPESKHLILGHQRPAFEKLLNIATATFNFKWDSLRLRPRTSTLLIGSTGTGKSFLARAIAEECGAAFLPLTAGDWILMGANGRGSMFTWPLIFRFLRDHQKSEGLIIFLDEIDKVTGAGSWDTHLRTEIFSLLDKRIPVGITDEDGEPADQAARELATESLLNRTIILGAGAWQSIWDTRSRSTMGFSDQNPTQDRINLNHLSATLPRELTNRFRSDLVILPQLEEPDYRQMLEQAGEEVPAYLRDTFFRIGNARIGDAVCYRQGCRFIEELLLDAVMAERAAIRSNSETSAAPHHAPDLQPEF